MVRLHLLHQYLQVAAAAEVDGTPLEEEMVEVVVEQHKMAKPQQVLELLVKGTMDLFHHHRLVGHTGSEAVVAEQGKNQQVILVAMV
jgi:hypothetical protein